MLTIEFDMLNELTLGVVVFKRKVSEVLKGFVGG